MPSQAEIEEYQQDVQELSAVAVAAVAAMVMAVSGDDEDSLATAIPAALTRYMASATVLAMNWYRGLAREQPRIGEAKPGALAPILGPSDRISLLDAQDFQPRPAELPPREQIERTVRWALSGPPEPERVETEPAEPDRESEATASTRSTTTDTTDPPARAEVIPADANGRQAQIISRMAGATQRYVSNAARDTVVSNAQREGVRWVRQARPNACAFCRMLATRGYLDPGYLTEASAVLVGASGRIRGSRKKGELYHDYCWCEPVPIRAGDSYEPPEQVADWSEQYYQAVDKVGNSFDTKAILAHMREFEAARGGSDH